MVVSLIAMPAISTKVKGKQLDQAYEYIMVAR
jgi:hypothetical protein